MSEFALHAFCTSCGAHRRRAPHQTRSKFFNDCGGPCGKCGAPSPGWDGYHVCRQVGPFWRRRWVGPDGVVIVASASPQGQDDER